RSPLPAAAPLPLSPLSLHDALPISEARQDLQPVHSRHLDVEEHDVGPELRIDAQRLAAAGGHADLVPLVLEELAQHLADALFVRSEEHTSELQSRENLVCRLLLEKR